MDSKSKTLRIVAALAMLLTTPVVDAQTFVCGPNGCTRAAATPVRTVARVATSPVRWVASAAPVRRVAAATRVGLFGRRVAYQSHAAPVVSAGSSGGYASYAAPSYGSTGGAPSYGSSGGSGVYGSTAEVSRTTAAPAETEPPAATVPGSSSAAEEGSLLDIIEKRLEADPDWRPGPGDDRLLRSAFEFWELLNGKTTSCVVPSSETAEVVCFVPGDEPSTVVCRVPSARPDLGAVAGL